MKSRATIDENVIGLLVSVVEETPVKSILGVNYPQTEEEFKVKFSKDIEKF